MQHETKYIHYKQDGEPARKAAITYVEASLDGLSDNDIQIIGHLVEAAEGMNPIFRDQFERLTSEIRSTVSGLIKICEGDEKSALENYLTMIDLQNSPYSLLPRKNHILDISSDRLNKLISKLNSKPEHLDAIVTLMTKGTVTPDKANYYPEDMSEEELKNLGAGEKIVNSSVVRDSDGDLHVVMNEDRYCETLDPVICHMRAARDLAEDNGLRLYLDAKILELETGSDESRRIADYTWVRHNCAIDIVISTGLEVYLDNLKNFRGAASGGVYVRNDAAEELLKALIDHVPWWEANAPWKYRKEVVKEETLPKLKFVNVFCWSGDYVSGPFTTIAQSLPNDEWVGTNVGTVNMVYMNTGRAVHSVSGNLAAKEFLLNDEYELVKDLIFDANQLHSALHEIGHTTGTQSPEAQGQPSNYLEEEYSYLEETRAELFGLFSLNKLVEDEIIDRTMAKACYNGMLISMIMSMKFDPVQAHNKARNGMFHYFEKEGVIGRVEEDGKTKFVIDHANAHEIVCEMIANVANIKAAGSKEHAINLREETVFIDPLKEEIENRTSDFPLGRGLIFPRLKKDGDKYLAELEYPESFNDQVKFNLELLD
jgi:Peptidase family M49